MAFLTVNGFEIPVADDSAGFGYLEIGERGRAFSGAARVSRQTLKKEGTFSTPPLLATDAQAYAGLLQSEGHVWAFENGFYSSKGLGKTSSTGTATVATPGTPKFTGALRLSGGSVASNIVWSPSNPFGTAYTVAFWRSTNNGAAWSHYVVRSDAAKWLNGVRADATSTTFLTPGAATITLADTAAAVVSYDDLIFYPFAILDTWAPIIAAASATWPAVPLLSVAGDCTPVTLSAYGQVTDFRLVQGSVGTWQSNLYTLSFTLAQV